jgi:hypothetical protein
MLRLRVAASTVLCVMQWLWHNSNAQRYRQADSLRTSIQRTKEGR